MWVRLVLSIIHLYTDSWNRISSIDHINVDADAAYTTLLRRGISTQQRSYDWLRSCVHNSGHILTSLDFTTALVVNNYARTDWRHTTTYDDVIMTQMTTYRLYGRRSLHADMHIQRIVIEWQQNAAAGDARERMEQQAGRREVAQLYLLDLL